MIGSPLTLVGAPGSPYSRKLRAVLRCRRIPHLWVQRGAPEARELPRPRVELLPQLVLPGADGRPEAAVDSTPLIRRLEALHAGRSVIPPDPVLAFLDALLEDYADEWLTKAMFHYRWAFAPDIAKAAALLPRWTRTDQPEDKARALGRAFAELGRVYAPFLLANADALARGAEQVECTIDGRPWVQRPFPYQAKCLGWLREARAALAPEDRRAADAILAGTGCEALFGA